MKRNLEATHGVIAYTDCTCNIGKRPKATLCEIDALFFEILEFLYCWVSCYSNIEAFAYIASSLPVSIPPSGRLLQHFDSGFILAAGSSKLYLRLLKFRLVLPLLLPHYHVRLCQEALYL
jgi:hypothetical protein